MSVTVTGEEHWGRRATCLGQPDSVFFPDLSGRGRRDVRSDPDAPEWAEARSFCDRCPVVSQCRAGALEDEARGRRYRPEGFRGGLTPGEREEIRRAATGEGVAG